MGAASLKTRDPEKCDYSPLKKEQMTRYKNKQNLKRNFKRCRLDKRFACTPENCPTIRQRLSLKKLGENSQCLTA